MTKKLILLLSLMLWNSFSVLSQENVSEKFSYRSFSISPFGIYSGENTSLGDNKGVIISGDVSFDYGKNLFSLAIGTAKELNILGRSDDFTEVNLLYGRSFLLNKKIFTELFVGAGYFHYNTME